MSKAMAVPTACAGGSDRAHLLALMAALASGDHRAAVALAVDFRVPLARVVRRHLMNQGVAHPSVDDVDGLTIEAAFEIADCATAWNPQGALPWIWAERRIAAAVARHVGQHADPFDPVLHGGGRVDRGPVGGDLTGPGPYAGDDPLLVEVLERAAGDDPLLGLLREALERALSARDRAMLLEYDAQRRAGDVSPAHTIGADFSMAPPAVRQAVRRARRRLQELAAADERFGPLATLPLVVGETTRPARAPSHAA